jgi:Mrp family chromosome partitioning ATPase
MNMEVSLEMAKNSVSSLDGELKRLNGKLYALVPNQAAIKKLQDDIDVYSREFVELSNKYNQASLESNFISKIRQVEMAAPGIQQPSKKILILLLAGAVSFVFCVMVLFVLFYLDNSIRDVQQLANQTQQPVIGHLNLIKGNAIQLKEIWNKSNDSNELQQLKNQLRSIRFEIDDDLNDSKIIAITSLDPGEGKSFFALNLAYAYTMINKKVLLIDGNFSDPEISSIVKTSLFLEDYLRSEKNGMLFPASNENFVVLGNKGGDTSILEVNSSRLIQSKLQALKDQFDVILIETPSLDTHNKAKEWMTFVDKVVPVFEAGQTIKGARKENIEYISTLHGKLIGWILNKVKTEKNKFAKTKKNKLEKKLAA